MSALARVFSVKNNRWFGVHNPFGSDAVKAGDPYINNKTLARLSFQSGLYVSSKVAYNLSARLNQGLIRDDELANFSKTSLSTAAMIPETKLFAVLRVMELIGVEEHPAVQGVEETQVDVAPDDAFHTDYAGRHMPEYVTIPAKPGKPARTDVSVARLILFARTLDERSQLLSRYLSSRPQLSEHFREFLPN
jgi:hypothetical protein